MIAALRASSEVCSVTVFDHRQNRADIADLFGKGADGLGWSFATRADLAGCRKWLASTVAVAGLGILQTASAMRAAARMLSSICLVRASIWLADEVVASDDSFRVSVLAATWRMEPAISAMEAPTSSTSAGQAFGRGGQLLDVGGHLQGRGACSSAAEQARTPTPSPMFVGNG